MAPVLRVCPGSPEGKKKKNFNISIRLFYHAKLNLRTSKTKKKSVERMLGRCITRSLRLAPRRVTTVAPVVWRLPAVVPTRAFNASTAFRQKQNTGDNDKLHLGSFKADKPMMMIAFTCKKCNTRSSHTMSKQAYTKGSVLIKCPGCNNRHLIADHLKIFSDEHVTVQDILSAKGESVSLTTDDLAFEDIPDNLKNVIGHYAKDAPEDIKKSKLDNESVHKLPPAKDD